MSFRPLSRNPEMFSAALPTHFKENTMIRIGFLNNIHSSSLWDRVAKQVEPLGIGFKRYTQREFAQLKSDCLEDGIDVLVTDMSSQTPALEELTDAIMNISHRAALSPTISAEFSTLSESELEVLREYFKVISMANYTNGLKYLAHLAGAVVEPELPIKVQTHGLYHPDAPQPFHSNEDYLAWYSKHKPHHADLTPIGLICYYGQIAEENLADINALIETLEHENLMPVSVFCDSINPARETMEAMYPWYKTFKSLPKQPALILNMLAGRLLAQPEHTSVLKALNVPVLHFIRNYMLTPEEWLEDKQGLSAMSLVHSLVQPEMFGVIEPTMIAATKTSYDAQTTFREFMPIPERIAFVAKRIKRWLKLQQKPNSEKKITIVLHNNPCKGVESTIGMAVGLDTFESLADVLKAMKAQGYHVGNAPENGKAILDMILNKKAISEFRWTTVDEIVRKGGYLHLMDETEYMAYFNTLDKTVQAKMIEDWEPFPGQGMVIEQDGKSYLVIVGLEFGNIKIMAQPKRGCYGAKCTGEVCRILHDPELAPPHHWLGTYYYIQKTSDAVIHFGTEGALEFLPGKRAALSSRCFSEISIGDLPNFYPYIMDVPGEGVIAKRRGRAVIVDHLTPAYRPAEISDDLRKLESLLEEYQRADTARELNRKDALKNDMLPLMQKLKFLGKEEGLEHIEEKTDFVSRQLTLIKRSLAPEGMHTFGKTPSNETIAQMLVTTLMHLQDDLPGIEELAQYAPEIALEPYDKAIWMISELLYQPDSDAANYCRKNWPELDRWCKKMADRLNQTEREIHQLLRGLNGEFIEPGLSGSLTRGKTEALPTGRNFFTTDIQALPTKAAWEVGKTLADKLLQKYFNEEGQFPEQIGMSLWSTDAFKSDGEMLSQILYLMGAQPVWESTGRVKEIQPIALEELQTMIEGTLTTRPRVDVTIETSGILRDMVPNFIQILDKAVVMLSRLEEPLDYNFIKKHTEEQIQELKRDVAGDLSDSDIQRLAMFRVFSSAPGTYGIGIGLALDASAWEDDNDLAEAYINWGGYAYGRENENFGKKAQTLFASQLKKVNISYMKQSSAEYDVLDCGCYASFQGGMATATRALSGKGPKIYWGDSNTPGQSDIRDFKDEIARSLHAKLLNDRWIENQKKHGFQGAQGVASKVNNLFKWSATSHEVEKWVFDSVAETYIQNKDNLTWLRQANPYALEEITRRLLEANARKLWQAPEDLLQEIQEATLMIEGDMEDIMGEVKEEHQGGNIDILTAKDVDKWNYEWKLSPSRKVKS